MDNNVITTSVTLPPQEVPGTTTWAEQMALSGKELAGNRVRHIIFAHGTFTGDDPLGINTFLGHLSAATGIDVFKTGQLKRFTKHIVDLITKDTANFTEEYIQLFASVLPDSITCTPFIWSGADHHLARLTGAVKLCSQLAGLAADFRPDDRILLLGHSHAGQIFALLTTLLDQSDRADALLAVVDRAAGLNIGELKKDLEKISRLKLDIVTFGTPVRYCWGQYDRYRLLNIINDRGNNVELSGLLDTWDGDYIQQWGIEGTDIFSERHHELNRELNTVLQNRGQVSPAEFLRRLEEKQRREPLYYDGTEVTETFLVDYLDQSPEDRTALDSLREFDVLPHCISTLFGHGVYTRYAVMLFNLRFIVEKFYPENKTRGVVVKGLDCNSLMRCQG